MTTKRNPPLMETLIVTAPVVVDFLFPYENINSIPLKALGILGLNVRITF